MAESSSSSGGIGVVGVTFIVFLVLKLTGVIEWSWWWITAPLWIGAVVCLMVFGAVITIVAKLKT